MRKVIEVFGYRVHPDYWKDIKEDADRLYSSHGDGWEQYVHSELEKFDESDESN